MTSENYGKPTPTENCWKLGAWHRFLKVLIAKLTLFMFIAPEI